MRALPARRSDGAAPVVTGFGEWGPWVNGGAWLSVRGQRVDLLYRSVEHLERALADARSGRHGVHHGQQPPFGYRSGTALGELAICVPLHDPEGVLAGLKAQVASYPEPLRRAVVADGLWAVELGLRAFAPEHAAKGDVYGVSGCLARFAHQLVLVLFAMNRAWLVGDRTALAEIDGFAVAPERFSERVRALLAHPAARRRSWPAALDAVAELWRETAALAGDPYASRALAPDRR